MVLRPEWRSWKLVSALSKFLSRPDQQRDNNLFATLRRECMLNYRYQDWQKVTSLAERYRAAATTRITHCKQKATYNTLSQYLGLNSI